MQSVENLNVHLGKANQPVAGREIHEHAAQTVELIIKFLLDPDG